MGNKQICGASLLLELIHQVQYLRPDGHIQRGDRFIGHHKFRAHNHSPGQSYPLALAAGELMGIACQMLRKQAHRLDNPLHLADTVRLVLVQVKIVQSLRNNIVHSSPLIERRRRVLEHHLDVADHLPVQAAGDLAGDADALIEDLAGRAGVGPDNGPADGGLAGAGLAYQGKGLPLVHIEGRVPHRADNVFPFSKVDVHMLQGQEDLLPAVGHRPVVREMGGAGVQHRGIRRIAHCTLLPLRC